jgi:hypothetical protein
MTATFSQTGGIRIGGGLIAFNATWPFATLYLTESDLQLRFLYRDYRFPKASIQKLSRHQGLFSVGLRIEHRIPSYPRFLVFWTFAFQKLKSELQRLGYEIAD